MDYTIFIQPAISIIVAIISGVWSYLASRANNKTEIEKQAKEHAHSVEKLEREFQYQLGTLKQQHSLEIEKLKQSHELRLQELEKVSSLDAEKDKALKLNEFAFKALTGEVDLDKTFALSDKMNAYNQKQSLQEQFIQKTSKKS
ncbi:hypothetical protein [Streptococcus sp. HN38]|uniref:hypothetical protein n=1 Tax=Streptococcus sp. HN38 TaxID=3020829 RepID=UPI00232F8E61|nr:hypothetical protein [Streptococcus sp. HN38]